MVGKHAWVTLGIATAIGCGSKARQEPTREPGSAAIVATPVARPSKCPKGPRPALAFDMQRLPEMPRPRVDPAMYLARDGRIVVGNSDHPQWAGYDSIDTLTPGGAWSSHKPWTDERMQAHVIAPTRDGLLLAYVARDHYDRIAAPAYELEGETWAERGPGLGRRLLPGRVLASDGRVLFVGGGDAEDKPTATTVVWSRDAGFRPSATMTMPRVSPRATLLADGRVLVTGGYKGLYGDRGRPEGEPIAEAEVWDPKTDRFTATAPMPIARGAHTTTLLPDGEVLVAGDQQLDLWDPSTGTWQTVGKFAEPRVGHSATLIDCRVLFVGGTSTAHALTAEVWNIAERRWETPLALLETRSDHGALLRPDGALLLVGGNEDGKRVELWTPVAVPKPRAITASVPAWSSLAGPVVALGDALVFPNAGKRVRAGGAPEDFPKPPVVIRDVVEDGEGGLVALSRADDHLSRQRDQLLRWRDGAWTIVGPAENAYWMYGWRTFGLISLGKGRVLYGAGPSVQLVDGKGTKTFAVPPRRYASFAAPLPDGRALIGLGGSAEASRPKANPDMFASLEDFVILDLSTGKLAPGPKREVSDGSGAIVLDDGRLMIFGGRFANKVPGIYDPKTRTWSAPKPAAEWVAAAVKLGDGRVLGFGASPRSVEVFDPKSNRWTVVGDVPENWTRNGGVFVHGEQIAVVADGRVVVLGAKW